MFIDIFWLPAGIALIAALLVILFKNPIRSVLSLIVTFCATAVTWLMFDSEFLGLSLILVYVGAVMVLFLFVVMMLDIKPTVINSKFTSWLPVGVILAITLSLSILGIFFKIFNFSNIVSKGLAYESGISNTSLLGELVFTEYLLQFEVAGVLLLVAIIAAISLIYRGPRDRKQQTIARQVQTTADSRIRLVDGI